MFVEAMNSARAVQKQCNHFVVREKLVRIANIKTQSFQFAHKECAVIRVAKNRW